MKKLFVSAGLVALGTAALHADTTYAPDITSADASKIWSVSGTLRGFYDDNYSTSHSDATGKRASFGFEFSPQASIIVPLQQTELGLRYTYGLYYYQDRQNLGQNPIDQSHQVDLWIDHAFSERWETRVMDTFVDAQNPQLTSAPTALPYRVTGNNLQNVGTVTVHTEWSVLFNTDLGYQNTWYDYTEHGATTSNFQGATYAGLLNQLAHSLWLNLNYQYLPDLSFQVGDQFGLVNYTGNEPVAQFIQGGFIIPGVFYMSNSRDQWNDSLYIGGQYSATETLSLSAQVGAEYVDTYNLPSFDHQSDTQIQPYASLALTYTYLPGDYAQLGLTQSVSPTQVATPDSSSGNLTLYQETSVVYASINHQITPYLLGSISGRYQYSTYQGGQFDGGSQNWYTLGLNLTYNINQYLSAEVGYSFDYFEAGNSAPSYTRNREYIGLTATY